MEKKFSLAVAFKLRNKLKTIQNRLLGEFQTVSVKSWHDGDIPDNSRTSGLSPKELLEQVYFLSNLVAALSYLIDKANAAADINFYLIHLNNYKALHYVEKERLSYLQHAPEVDIKTHRDSNGDKVDIEFPLAYYDTVKNVQNQIKFLESEIFSYESTISELNNRTFIDSEIPAHLREDGKVFNVVEATEYALTL
jgi:hypothetical protein